MRRWLQSLLVRWAKALKPKPDFRQENKHLKEALSALVEDQSGRDSRAEAVERVAELAEARQMAGSGPWKVGAGVLAETDNLISHAIERLNSKVPGVPLRESVADVTGASGDLYLMLENVEWRREVNLSWLEFSRWGIQQIILISRLYFIKNPIIRRLITIASVYPFARGFEVSTDNQAANVVLEDFFDRNKSVLGQIALVELEQRKYYDGNLFFAFFADEKDTGEVNIRTIDATEIQEIVTNPDDAAEPWFYRRQWAQFGLDPKTGELQRSETQQCWYPALKYSQTADRSLKTIGSFKIMWDVPVLHRKCGGVANWLFGCPLIYPALDWAKASRKYLDDCATVKRALARIALVFSTKGGQQAIQGAKQQLETNVNTGDELWDTNPPSTVGSIFASGPGTTLSAFNSKGAGGDPEEVRRYLLMCCMVVGVPETFLADVSTGNLATATTLDRPTELVFLEKQEAWREDLVTIAQYVLSVSGAAASGKLRESIGVDKIRIIECRRVLKPNGQLVYEAAKKTPGTIKVKCTFPAIREGDQSVNIKSIVESMTLDNKGGQIVGIDEKVGVTLLYRELGVENADEEAEKQYPDGEYEPDRTKEDIPAPIGRAEPDPGGSPQDPGGVDPAPQDKKVAAA